MRPIIFLAAMIALVLIGIAAMKSNGATEHPLLADAQAANVPPCTSLPPPQCKPQGDIDCLRNRTQEIA